MKAAFGIALLIASPLSSLAAPAPQKQVNDSAPCLIADVPRSGLQSGTSGSKQREAEVRFVEGYSENKHGIAAMPCLFSECPGPLPISVCCFVSEPADTRPLRETSAMRQGSELLAGFCGAGAAKLLSGEAKSNAIPNAAFMIFPSSASRLTHLPPLVKVQFRAKLAHRLKQVPLFRHSAQEVPRKPLVLTCFIFNELAGRTEAANVRPQELDRRGLFHAGTASTARQ